MSRERQAINDIKRRADRINARLVAHGCAPCDFTGGTLYKPVLVRLMTVVSEAGRQRADFVVRFPERDGDIAVFSAREGQFSLYFSAAAGKDVKGRLLPHDGSSVQALERGGFSCGDGTVRHWGKGWSITWT